MSELECLNCKTPLKGRYCYVCGQPDRHLIRFFPVLIRDLLADALDLDSRFFKTLIPLLFQPGKLTNAYIAGRRARFVPPLRLYLFSSLLFFLLAAFVTPTQQNSKPILQISDTHVFQHSFENGDGLDHKITREDLGIELSDDGLSYLNEQLEILEKNGRRALKNPQKLIDAVYDILPQVMFILLPVFALLLKLIYVFKKRFYVEHLIYALHTHSFLFVSGMIFIGLEKLESLQVSVLSKTISYLLMALGVWIPLYLFLSLKNVYAQGWLMTIFKSFLISLSYSALLIAMLSLAMIYSVWSF